MMKEQTKFKAGDVVIRPSDCYTLYITAVKYKKGPYGDKMLCYEFASSYTYAFCTVIDDQYVLYDSPEGVWCRI